MTKLKATLSGAVGVALVLDSEDHDFPLDLVDPVQHSIGASASGEDTRQVAAQLFADSLRIGTTVTTPATTAT